ncbi:MAG: GTPase ObgE [Clostridia bacterium]
MFVDKVKIFLKSGDGGNGSVAFHTEKFVPNGGPDGGDGGRGGDVIFEATHSLNTLNDFAHKKHFKASNGENGSGNKKFGRGGEDLVIKVPVGTVVKDFETERIIADMFADGQRTTIYKGGKGGRGNYHYANSRRQAPHFAQNGVITPEIEITLELKTIADVGLIGFPNVGKSTLLSVISNATPKIANYPFTTLSPNLGVVKHYDDTFVVADIPGLIEGASDGLGLGHDFLRHIERVRLLVHVVDISGSEEREPIEDFKKINNELKSYSKYLSKLPQIVVANKMDMPCADQNYELFCQKYGKKYKIYPAMALIHEGIKPLLDAIVAKLDTLPKVEPLQFEPYEIEQCDINQFEVVSRGEGIYEVVGGFVKDIARKIYLDDTESFRYFQTIIKKKGIIDQLKAKGMQEGDTVVIGEIEFEYME